MLLELVWRCFTFINFRPPYFTTSDVTIVTLAVFLLVALRAGGWVDSIRCHSDCIAVCWRWWWPGTTAVVVVPRRHRAKTFWSGFRCLSHGSTCSASSAASSTAPFTRPLAGPAASRASSGWLSWRRVFYHRVSSRSQPDWQSTNTYTKQSSGESTSYPSVTKVCVCKKNFRKIDLRNQHSLNSVNDFQNVIYKWFALFTLRLFLPCFT